MRNSYRLTKECRIQLRACGGGRGYPPIQNRHSDCRSTGAGATFAVADASEREVERKQKKATIRKILSGLPHVTATDLREALDDPSRFDTVRRLILRHTEWLPLEYYMSPKYTFRLNVSISRESRVDCFAGRLDTIGPRAHLYYLASPYRKAIDALGRPSPELRKLLGAIQNHVLILGRDLKKSHKLSIAKLFQSQLSGWTSMIGHYAFLKIYVIAGRRHHYQCAERHGHNIVVSRFNGEIQPTHPWHQTEFEMLTYDRILDAIAK